MSLQPLFYCPPFSHVSLFLSFLSLVPYKLTPEMWSLPSEIGLSWELRPLEEGAVCDYVPTWEVKGFLSEQRGLELDRAIMRESKSLA